jgi:hypothetical protein
MASTCPSSSTGFMGPIARTVFDESQKTRLAQVASRCPVHKTLANGAHIVDAVGFVEKGD